MGFKVATSWLKRGVGVDELCGVSHLFHVPRYFQHYPIPIRKKMMSNYVNRGGTLSQTFPDFPKIFRVSSGNPESRLRVPLGLGILKEFTGNVERSRTARCLRIVKFSCVRRRIHFVLEILDLSHELTHSHKILPSLQRPFINFKSSGSICFFATDSLQFFNFLAISCVAFLEESFSHFQSSEKIIFSLIRLVQFQSRFHKGPYQIFFVPNHLWCLLQPQVIVVSGTSAIYPILACCGFVARIDLARMENRRSWG